MSNLSDIFRGKLIPMLQPNASERFIIAGTRMSQAAIPSGVRLSRHKLEPPRIAVRNRRCYNSVRNVLAEWPREKLQELGKSTLICTLDGSVDYPLGKFRLQCGPGYFIFVPPGTPVPDAARVYVDLESSTSCEIITFLQHPNALECWTSHNHRDTKTLSNNCLFAHERVSNIFHALMEEILSGDSFSRPISEELLSVFFKMLQREIAEERFHLMHSNDASGLPKSFLSVSPASFKARLEHYIQANLRQPLTQEKAARDFYLSPSQFARNIRSATGQSFNLLLAEARLDEAKNLLRNSDWAVFAIAGLAGFRSVSYFCTFFKEHTGQTPSEFRAQPITKPHRKI